MSFVKILLLLIVNAYWMREVRERKQWEVKLREVETLLNLNGKKESYE